MNKPWCDQKITEFVKGVLGCKCPVEVFNTIVISQLRNQHIPFSISRFNIGDTLLLYVASPASSDQLQNALSEIACMGRDDRDLHGFNRFRLVIADRISLLNPKIAERQFIAEAAGDGKMHIHFVEEKDVCGLI
jgi:hypothetical protein